jgi:PPOX class probable F420-dependent enzyme
VTTPRPKGAPVSARVPGIVDGARAYVRAGDGSGMDRRLRRAGQVQVTACDALGLVSYGPPRYADIRPLAGEEADRAAGQLARRYPVKRGVLAWLPRRKPVLYELTVP